MRSTLITFAGLAIGGVLAVGYLTFGSREGEAVIADMHRVESLLCSCEPGDRACLELGIQSLRDLENQHFFARGTAIQEVRLEASVERTAACLERLLVPAE